MRIEEVNGKDEPYSQQGLFAVDQQGNVEPRSGQEPGKKSGEPHDVAGKADNAHAPEYGPVIEFFPVGKVFKFGLRPPPEKPAEMAIKIFQVLEVWNH